MEPSYWRRKASPWVSAAVLIGGMATACILFVLVRIQNDINSTIADTSDTYSSIE